MYMLAKKLKMILILIVFLINLLFEGEKGINLTNVFFFIIKFIQTQPVIFNLITKTIF